MLTKRDLVSQQHKLILVIFLAKVLILDKPDVALDALVNSINDKMVRAPPAKLLVNSMHANQ